MPYRNDKVTDVMAVLAVIRDGFSKGACGRDSAELRKQAVSKVAESELQTRRYRNMDSALKTIHDACARRLGHTIKNFDKLTEDWLFGKSPELRDLLLAKSESSALRAEVVGFFRVEKEQ